MEAKSLFKNDLVLTLEITRDEKLRFAHALLTRLLSPYGDKGEKILEWVDEYIVGNPYFDAERATSFRESVRRLYETAEGPVEGLEEPRITTLAEMFSHPGLNQQKEQIEEIFRGIGPVIWATREAILAVQRG